MNLTFSSKALVIIAFSLIVACSLKAQKNDISIDEDFDDWDAISLSNNDGEDVSKGIDLLNFKATNDEDNLYIYCEFANEINLVNNIFTQDLILHFDLDNNASTGQQIQEKYGIDLSVDFLAREAYYYAGANIKTLYFGDLGFLSAPTVSTFKIEIAIDLDAKVDGVKLFSADSVAILFQDKNSGDRMPNIGEVFNYVFQSNENKDYTPIDLNKSADEFIRAITYNVLFNSGWAGADKLKNLKSISQSLDGDIYAFQESSGTSASEAVDYFNTWLPIDNGTWYARKSGGLITVSKWPILDSWVINRQLATLIELPEAYGTNFFVVNAHLSCCSNNNGRQDQVDEFCSFLRDAKTKGGDIDLEENTPIVYLGDFNLVGYNQQVETIMNGDIQNTGKYGAPFLPDWDSSALADAKPYQADAAKVYTWRSFGNGRIYPPGRLDYQFYTDSELALEKTFVLNTATMSTERLTKYDLNAEDTDLTADHLPVVADYSIIDEATSNNGIENSNIKIFPNPANGSINITSTQKVNLIKIIDLSGKTHLTEKSPTSIIQLGHLKPGIYLLEIYAQDQKVIKKLYIN